MTQGKSSRPGSSWDPTAQGGRRAADQALPSRPFSLPEGYYDFYNIPRPAAAQGAVQAKRSPLHQGWSPPRGYLEFYGFGPTAEQAPREGETVAEAPVAPLAVTPAAEGAPVHAASGPIQRAAQATSATPSSRPEGAQTALARAESSTGQGLPDPLRGRLEAALGSDLSMVRTHTGPDSSEAASRIQARAYTVGQDIHFGTGQYDPGSAAGEQLIAHEVAHTVQQRGAPLASGQAALEISQPHDPLEVEAEHFATSFVAGAQHAIAPISRGSVARQVLRETLKKDAKDNGEKATPAAIPVHLPTPLRSRIGSVDYYAARHDDFARTRYPAPPPSPPSYYLGYGDKYAKRFTSVLKPKLSAKGQAWIERTFILLQQAIENRLADDPAAFDQLEKNDAAFLRFAYDTHPRAYLDGGLHTLGPSDLGKILITPDLGDLLTIPGVVQVLKTAGGILPQWGNDVLDAGKDAGNAIKDGVKKAWDWLKP